jgi:DHA2 family multidrug resistance protein
VASQFGACCIIIFCAYAVLYGASTSLPGLLQSLFGYNALNAGLVMSPSGFFAVLAMPVVGFMLGRKTDARWLIGAGLLLMAISNYWMSQMNLLISPGQVVWPRVVMVLGLSICFAPANVAAYLYTPTASRGAAVGLLSLLRNEGGSVGTSLAQTLQEWRDQFHTLRLGEYLDPFNPAVQSFVSRLKRVSCSRLEIRLLRSSWHGRHSRICASSKRPRWPISMSFGCWPW